MKRLLSVLLVAVLLGLFASCTNSAEKSETTQHEIPLPGETQQTATQFEPLPLAGLSNPLTGLPALDGAVDGQRPVAVALMNDAASQPLRGIAGSDVWIEGLNERGTTTVLAMFGDFRTVPQVGPVSEVSDPFLQFSIPSNAIPVHLSTTQYATNLLNVLAYQDVSGINVGTTAFVYDTVRASTAGGNRFNENCWYTDANLIWNAATSVGINPLGEVRMLFNFTEDTLPSGDDVVDVSFSFNSTTPVTLHYDVEAKTYQKTAHHALQVDETGAAVTFNNAFILFGDVTQKADSLDLDYNLTEGDGFYFQGGLVTPIRWQKGGPTDALRLIDVEGNELEVQQGKSYIAFLPEAQRETMVTANAEERAQAIAAAEAAAEAAAAEAAAAEAAAAEAAAAEAAAAEAAAAEAAAAEAAPPA